MDTKKQFILSDGVKMRLTLIFLIFAYAHARNVRASKN